MPDSSGGILDAIAHPASISPNLLSSYGQGQQIAGQVNANRLFQSQTAQGQALQAAVDPATGKVDPLKYNQLIASNPAAAQAAPDAINQSQKLSDAQLTQAREKAAWVNQASGAVLQSGDYSDAGMMKLFQAGMANGVLTLPDVQKQLAALPPDPSGRATWLQQHQMTSASTQQQLDQTYGTRVTIDNGQQIQGGVQAPASQGGALNVGGQPTVQTYPSRGALAGRVQTGLDANGAPIQGPLANVTPPGLAGPAGAPPSPLGTGRPAAGSPLLNPNAPPPPAAAASAVPNDGNVVAGLGPAQAAARTATGTASAGAFSGYNDDAARAANQKSLLGNMLADTTQFTSGPGTSTLANVRAIAQRFGYPLDDKATNAAASFNKLQAQLLTEQGAGSDSRMNIAQAGTPHGEMPPQALDQALRQMQGNADYLGARSQLAGQWPDKADRTGFENSIRSNLDPRAFQFARLTNPQKVTYYNSLSDDDKKAVKSSYNWAVNNKVIGAGNGQ